MKKNRSTLEKRIWVAIPLIVLALAWLFSYNNTLILVVSALLIAYGTWEWSQFLTRNKRARILYCVIVYVCTYLLFRYADTQHALWIFNIIWWVIASIFVLCYQKTANTWTCGFAARGFMGLVFLSSAFISFNLIYTQFGPVKMIFLFLMVWAADTGAYFCGKALGKRTLIKTVSPNKTWEGAVGGWVALMIVTFIFYLCFLKQAPFAVFVFGCLIFLFALFGDLVESLQKRVVGLKDSGHVLPGHGGLLDRLDSLIATLPIYYLGLLCLGVSLR